MEFKRRIDDAIFLWNNGRGESAFPLALITVAAISKLRYKELSDGKAIKKTDEDFHIIRLSVES